MNENHNKDGIWLLEFSFSLLSLTYTRANNQMLVAHLFYSFFPPFLFVITYWNDHDRVDRWISEAIKWTLSNKAKLRRKRTVMK